MKRYLSIIAILLIAFSASAAELKGVESQGNQFGNPLEPLYWVPEQIEITPAIDPGAVMGAGTDTRASSRTCTDDDLVVNTLGNNVACYETTNAVPMMLREPLGENLITYSEAFRAAVSGWTNDNTSVTDDATTAPDNVIGADKIVEDIDVASQHYIKIEVAEASVTDNVNITFSIYLKPAERSWAKISFRNKNLPTVGAYFNLATGAIGTETVDYYGSKPAGNGFIRYWITHDTGSGVRDLAFYLRIAIANDSENNDGDGTSGIYAWGAQVEESPVPTSYIPTSGAVATRASEGGNPHYNIPLARDGVSPLFETTLGAEQSTGNLVIGTAYKITADEGSHFFAGSATGMYFPATAATGLDASNKVQEVTNPGDDGYPQQWTLQTLVSPGFGEADVSTDGAFISLADQVAGPMYQDVSGNGIAMHDGTTEATYTLAFTKGLTYLWAAQAAVNSNVYQMRICSDDGASGAVACGSWFAYDGSMAVGGDEFQLANSLQGPFHIGSIKVSDSALTTDQIREIR